MPYIDPGAGTILLQTIIAAFIGGVAYFRKSIGLFLGIGRRRRNTEEHK
jgi:hypothetical protein